ARSLRSLGQAAQGQSEYKRAVEFLEESLILYKEIEGNVGAAMSLCFLGRAEADRGNLDKATKLVKDGFSIFQEMGNKWGVAWCFECLASVALYRDRAKQAVRLFGAAEALRDAAGVPVAHADRVEYDKEVAAVRSKLGNEKFSALWAEGRSISIEEAIEYALE
ncbi:unnamed protein product, partial [marine sediment metagenome]